MTTAKLADGGVTTAKLVDSSVTSAKIADRSITGSDFASDVFTSDYIVDSTVDSEVILDGTVGEVDLDIRLVRDFDVIARTGQHSVADAVAIAGFADAGTLTASGQSSRRSLARIRTAYAIVSSFQSSGVVASSHAAFSELSADVALRIGGLLGGSALAQQV